MMNMSYETIEAYLTSLDKKASVMTELTDVNRLVKGLKEEKSLSLDPVLVEGKNGYEIRYSDGFGLLYKIKKDTPKQGDGITHILSLDQHKYNKVFRIENPREFYANVIQLAINDVDDSPTDTSIDLAIDNAIRYVGEGYIRSVSPRSGGGVGYASSSLSRTVN